MSTEFCATGSAVALIAVGVSVTSLLAGYVIGIMQGGKSMAEAAAELADWIEVETHKVFKGLTPERGNLRRGDPYTDGYAAGAAAVAAAIREGM